jgi:AraC-like DNA-binding protein
MAGSVTSVFSEPEDFEDALRKEGCRGLIITGRGEFRAQLTQITLHGVRLLEVEEQLARIAFIEVSPDMVVAAFPIGEESVLICGGVRTLAGEIMILSPGEQVHLRVDAPCRWGAIWFPADELVQYGRAMTDAAFTVGAATGRWRPAGEASRRLRSLHSAAIRVAAARPRALVAAEAARGLEQQLIDAIVECLSAGSAADDTRSKRRNRDIMARFEQLVQRGHGKIPAIPELSMEIGVSERLLRSLCAEHLGMSPTEYDRRRRMDLARRALRRGADEVATVSKVASHHGFRDPGRFSINYRAAFGETPSATLRRGARSGTGRLGSVQQYRRQ